MTSGEKAIWATAFVQALREHLENIGGVIGDLGSPAYIEACRRRMDQAEVIAALRAAGMVRAARTALDKLISLPKANERGAAARTEAIDMLREMLGVTETSYRDPGMPFK